jgi:hypothetical protein
MAARVIGREQPDLLGAILGLIESLVYHGIHGHISCLVAYLSSALGVFSGMGLEDGAVKPLYHAVLAGRGLLMWHEYAKSYFALDHNYAIIHPAVTVDTLTSPHPQLL